MSAKLARILWRDDRAARASSPSVGAAAAPIVSARIAPEPSGRTNAPSDPPSSLSGGTDFQIEIACADVGEYERTVPAELLEMPEIRDIRSNLPMRRYRASGPLPSGA